MFPPGERYEAITNRDSAISKITSNKYGRWLLWSAYAYLPVMLFSLLVMRFAGEHWWPSTMLLFGPRWLAAVPLLFIMALAGFYNRRLLIPLFLGALIVFGPLMGLCVNLWKPRNVGTPAIRIITCNIDTGSFNAAAFSSLIKESSPDIVALQECPEDINLTLPAGWKMITERGLAIISKFPLRKINTVQITPPKSQWPGTYLLHAIVQAPGGDVDFCSIQLPTPRFGLMQLLDRKTILRPSRSGLLYEAAAFRQRVSIEVSRYIESLTLPVIIAGDFNTPVDSTLYRLVWNNYTNAFSDVGSGYGWTQRVSVGGFSYSSRIDHVLTGKGLTPRLCEVGPDVGSDHLPVIADVGR